MTHSIIEVDSVKFNHPYRPISHNNLHSGRFFSIRKITEVKGYVTFKH